MDRETDFNETPEHAPASECSSLPSGYTFISFKPLLKNHRFTTPLSRRRHCRRPLALMAHPHTAGADLASPQRGSVLGALACSSQKKTRLSTRIEMQRFT